MCRASKLATVSNSTTAANADKHPVPESLVEDSCTNRV
jgi:hypothetical protein